MSPTQLSTFEVDATSELRGTVIWMHGLGASSRDFEDVVPLLKLPGVRFVFPAAPTRAVTINHGMKMPAWYDIISLDDPPRREDEAGVREAEGLVAAVIEREIARGVPSERIVLMGFSQGGAMALHVGVRFPQRLAGIGVLSGYLLLPERLLTERQAANTTTPVLFCHGEQDPTVRLQLGRRAFDVLSDAGQPTTWHTFPMGHSLCLPEVDVLREWLRTCGLC